MNTSEHRHIQIINSVRGWRFVLAVCACVIFFSNDFLAQATVEAKKQTKIIASPVLAKSVFEEKLRNFTDDSSETAEKSIAVDAKVKLQLCVSTGKLKVNGWERSEIRAFVGGRSQVSFKVLQKNEPNGTPVWVEILGFDPAKNDKNRMDECLSGDEIELDVPRGATVNVKGSESETTIDSVRKATVEIEGGDIFFNNISEGIYARTFEGGVTVENSSGAITLMSTTGNILAFDVGASEIGDVFKAKTNSGAIALQKIGHRQIEVGSNSGSIRFAGAFQSGGQYNLGTQNGSISLSLPEKSSFKLNASYGFGAFGSELPLQYLDKNPTPKAQNLSAQMGSGDATVTVKTVSGAIRIRKQ